MIKRARKKMGQPDGADAVSPPGSIGALETPSPIPAVPVKGRKIALVGTAGDSVMLAPWKDTEWELWGVGPALMQVATRLPDQFFEMHALDKHFTEPSYFNYCSWLLQIPKLWFIKAHPRFPNSLTFPRAEVKTEFGRYGWNGLTIWMMAKAIMEAPEQIGIWGMDMSTEEEYLLQRGPMQALIKIAMDRGIGIIVPPESDLLEPSPDYGFCEESRMWRRCNIRKLSLENERERNINNVKELLARNHQIDGELNILKWLDVTFVRELEAPV